MQNFRDGTWFEPGTSRIRTTTLYHEAVFSPVLTKQCYGLDSPEIESQWGRDFLHPSRPALGPTSCTKGAGPFLGVRP